MLEIKWISYLAAGLILSFVISGCGTSLKTDTASICTLSSPIYIGESDVLTDKTAEQILSHNLLGAKLCGWGSKK